MGIPIQWENLLEENLELKEMFLEQETMDRYGDEPIPPFFLHYFRPKQYSKLKEFFMPFSHGYEMFNKLKMIYDITADNYEGEDGSVAAYFIPKKDTSIAKKDLERLALQHAEAINDILRDSDETSLIDCANLEISIISRDEFNEKYDYEDILECELHDIKGDWFIDLVSEVSENPLTFFAEPLYYIACDYNIARYVMWPIMEKVDMNNPFEAYFNLWKHGYEPNFISSQLLVLTY